ncbi:S8 family serine peptidase, partial [Myxococcota bacterium]|nr:S8 family serine peptidase [Myxococcota bacterium]
VVNGNDLALQLLAELQRYATPQTVAVIDTGVNGFHEDLYGLVIPAVDSDQHGHGTAVAGRVAANTNNGLGLASLNYGGAYLWVRSYPALAAENASGDDIARAIIAASNADVSVINMSFGGRGEAPAVVVEAINYALSKDVILVAAAGNGGPGVPATAFWPANVEGVLAISAVDRNNIPAEYASRVDDLPLGAWSSGDGVCVLDHEGGYRRESGTSFAAPQVAGLLGVARSLCPTLTYKQAFALLLLSGIVEEDGSIVFVQDRFLLALAAAHKDICTSP